MVRSEVAGWRSSAFFDVTRGVDPDGIQFLVCQRLTKGNPRVLSLARITITDGRV